MLSGGCGVGVRDNWAGEIDGLVLAVIVYDKIIICFINMQNNISYITNLVNTSILKKIIIY